MREIVAHRDATTHLKCIVRNINTNINSIIFSFSLKETVIDSITSLGTLITAC